MSVEKPRTQKEMLQQIWWVLFGANGNGMVGDVANIRAEVKDIKKMVYEGNSEFDRYKLTRADTCPIASGQKDRRKNMIDLAKVALPEIMKILASVGIFTAIGKFAGFL